MFKIVTSNCRYCGKEFTQTLTGGHPSLYCCDECRRKWRNENRRKTYASPYERKRYLKGSENVLDVLLEELKEKDMDFGEYKKQLALSRVERIKL